MLYTYLGSIFYILFTLRFLTIFISAKNEKKLLRLGSIEFGKRNSLFLVIAHFTYYAACLTKGYIKSAFYHDSIALTGFFIYVFSILMLYYVIYSIRHIWTVKLIIAPEEYHEINSAWLFRVFKHPNYFLNILPELIGLAMLFHAWFTLIIGFPIYLIPLIKRIRLEEKMMRQYFVDYK